MEDFLVNSEAFVNSKFPRENDHFVRKPMMYSNSNQNQEFYSQKHPSLYPKPINQISDIYGQVYPTVNTNANFKMNNVGDVRQYRDYGTRPGSDIIEFRARTANCQIKNLDTIKGLEKIDFSSQDEDDDDDDEEDYEEDEYNEIQKSGGNNQDNNSTNNQRKRNVKTILSHPDFSTMEIKGKGQNTQKGNVKNAYIKKIHSVINFYKTEESISDEKLTKKRMRKKSKDFNANTTGSNGDEGLKHEDLDKDTNTKKLERNRESARNSRQRKKFYMELLEDKVNELQQEINEAKSKLDENYYEYNRVWDNVNSLKGLLMGERQTVEDLEKIIYRQVNDRSQYDMIFENFKVIKLRLGPNGNIRKEALNQFFSQIQNHFLPLSLKGLLITADQEEKIYMSQNAAAIEQLKKTSEDLKLKFGMQPEQEENFKISMAKLAVQKRRFDEVLKRMFRAKQNLDNEIKDLEMYSEELNRILSPNQIARFYIKVAKGKSEIQQIFDRRWFQGVVFKRDAELDIIGIKRERYYSENQIYETNSFPNVNVDNNYSEFPVKKRLFN